MHKNKTHIAVKNGTHHAAEKIVAELLMREFAQDDSVLVAIGGPGGTGKSTFARVLADGLPDAVILRLDDYKTSRVLRAEKQVFGPHPEANKLDLMQEHFAEIKAGRTFQKPVYDSPTGEARQTEAFVPRQFNLLDGEVSTYPAFREQVDFSIFIDSDWKTQLATRIDRDIETRGYDREKAIATFLQSNLREFSEYGAESKKWADLHLYCDEDYHLEIESVSDTVFLQHHDLFDSDYAEVGLKGLVVPVLTPFSENWKIDERAFIRHLEFLAQHGVHRIMVNGTTAEFFSLLPEERKQLLKLARRYFPGMIIQHAGGTGLEQNKTEVRWANDFGADAVAVLPPIYPSGLPEAGIIQYFQALEAEADVPFLLYNFPKHTGNGITPKILREVPHYGLKDSARNFELMEHTPNYFVGSSTTVFEPVQQGAAGFVSATANVRPELYAAFEMLLVDAKVEEAAVMQQEVKAYSARFSAGGIPMLKESLARKLDGYPTRVRAPLI
ncbi:dihydrodipicolinate synthase family protein [Pontiella agarivorans]|uniref:Dihydrodipicolinate synthase family protein n=1 Tax=Pontiella agarivorans TaxID=3038953 RepID=A0ABU5MVH1_9BACT|nr:dihydrodipicolinate synthase family protein [Pontiella agarivorans]MDZ8118127.1 dihydrodipicolinate synthase family protein [Pontiella agarivorans]